MSKAKKALARLKSKPKDFTWQELETVLNGLGFETLQGKGSRIKFTKELDGVPILISLHKPHPRPELKRYIIEEVLEKLKESGDIDE